jgi:hypothetical protein
MKILKILSRNFSHLAEWSFRNESKLLRKYKPKHHWHIDSWRAYDTFGALTKHFEVDPMCFFDTFLSLTNAIESDYFQQLDAVKACES